MLETFVSLLVPFEMPDHLFFLDEDASSFRALLAVKVLSIVELSALQVTAFHGV
jgi:hypothetical protein